MNLHEKLIEVRKVVPYLQKENKGSQYQYVSSSQVLSNCKQKMDELKILLVPMVTGHKVSESPIEQHDKDGNVFKRTTTYFTELDMTMTWVNAEKPDETISCPWYGQGVDIAGEKGVGKAMTYAEKYFMLKFFNIPTDKDDPDSFQDKIDTKEQKKDQPQKQPQKPPQSAPKEERAKTANTQPPKEAPINWKGFWTKCKSIGYTEAQVHAFAKTESLADWTRSALNALLADLEAVKKEEMQSA